MNTQSFEAIPCRTRDEVFSGPVGSFTWLDNINEPLQLFMKLPEADLVIINVERPGQEKPPSPSWSWDGNTEKPTLSPSIHVIGFWHGWLRSGRFVSC